MAKLNAGTLEISTLDHNSKIILDLLNAVQDNASRSQRSIANELGVALGLTNAYLKRCVKKGLIKVRQVPANRYAYYLTPQGFAEKSRLTASYLSQSFEFFRRARKEGSEMLMLCERRGWNRVVLYGVSEIAEIVTLCARDSAVELRGVADERSTATEFVGLPVKKNLSHFKDYHAVIFCSVQDPQGSFDMVRSQIGDERVLAPSFLNLSRAPSGQELEKD